MDVRPYLSAEDLETRRIVLIHCEDDACGFVLEFIHSNCTFFFCKEHNVEFNIDLSTISEAGVLCEQNDKMERYDIFDEDNLCPFCERSTMAIVTVGI